MTPGTQARSLRPILAIAALTAMATSAMRPMVAYRALELGAGPAELGLIASSHVALSIVGAMLVGRSVDRLGARYFLVLGGVLIALAATGASWAPTLLILVVAQAVLGLGQTAALVAAQGSVANQTSHDRGDADFGSYAFATSVGHLIGPAVSGFIAGATSAGSASGPAEMPVFVISAGLGLLLIPIAMRARVGPLPVERGEESAAPPRSSLRAVLGRPQMMRAMTASMGVVLSLNLLMIYLPALGEVHGLSVELVGVLLATRAAGSMVSRLFVGRLVRVIGRTRALTGSMVLAAVMLALLPLVGTAGVLLPLMFLLGIGLGLGGPMTMAWVAGGAAPTERATALGIRLTGNRVGQLVLPAALGLVAGAAGLHVMFWTLAAMLGAGATVVSRARFDPLPHLRNEAEGD